MLVVTVRRDLGKQSCAVLLRTVMPVQVMPTACIDNIRQGMLCVDS